MLSSALRSRVLSTVQIKAVSDTDRPNESLSSGADHLKMPWQFQLTAYMCHLSTNMFELKKAESVPFWTGTTAPVTAVVAFSLLRILLTTSHSFLGRMLYVSSIFSFFNCLNMGAYCVSKRGLEAFADCLRVEMASFGVKVRPESFF